MVGTGSARRVVALAFTAVGLLLAAAHPLVPSPAQPVLYLLVTVAAMASVALPVVQNRGVARRPWLLLFLALVLLNVGNGFEQYFLYVEHLPTAEHTITDVIYPFGYLFMLTASLVVVVTRGRDDIGGVLDGSVVAVAAGGLVWDFVLLPHLTRTHAGLATQLPLFIDIIALTGVLGALGRVWLTSRENIGSLRLLVVSLLVSLGGVVMVPLARDPITGHHPVWTHSWFMVAYVAVGAAALHGSASLMGQPGPAPQDSLTRGRLVFLGLALGLSPLVGGGRALIGLPVDGVLLAVGSAVVVPIVMLRIGRLAAQRERAEQALAYQAAHDALTGLLNRRAFSERLDQALDAFRAGTLSGLTVLFCDLDGFKAVNDRLGHASGDELLVRVAERLSSCIRETDVLGRFGGDEFLILCTAGRTESVADRLLHRITAEFDKPVQLAADAVSVGVSIGLIDVQESMDAEEVIRRADEQMYLAKQVRRASVASAAPAAR